MNAISQEERYARAQKRVQKIIGFYTHLIVTVFIIPFIIFINLDGSPQFHWFWFFIGAWTLGVLIHWINVFGVSKMTLKRDWEQRKLKEILGEDINTNNMTTIATTTKDYSQELQYIRAKKRVEAVKGFYVHLIVMLLTAPLIIWVNYEFVPGFHFFWYAVGGMTLSILFHWLGVFGFSYRKIQELMKKDNF
jgi:hypothetical protein